jgi:hypothetical protein
MSATQRRDWKQMHLAHENALHGTLSYCADMGDSDPIDFIAKLAALDPEVCSECPRVIRVPEFLPQAHIPIHCSKQS